MAKSKKKKRVKVGNLVLLLVIVGFLLIVVYCFIMMPIKNIYINGNEIIDDNEIMEISGVSEYPSFILANRFEMKKKLKGNSYIKDVKIKKKRGNVLEIEIDEYKVIASNVDGKILLSSGDVINNNNDIFDVPILLNDIDSLVFDLFVIKMEKLDSNILRQISEIEYSPVEVDKERFLFYMSDGNVVHVTLTKLFKLNKYNKIKDKLGNRKGIIYLDSGDYVELVN